MIIKRGTKKPRVLILIVFILSVVILMGFPKDKDKITIDNTPKDSRLADSDLLFVSFSSSGMCRLDSGEEGGCYTHIFLYNSGKYINESGFEGVNDKKVIFPMVEKELEQSLVDEVIKQIRESDIMKKDCPAQQNEDAWFYYQINLDGSKKVFGFSPPTDCQSILNKINILISSKDILK